MIVLLVLLALPAAAADSGRFHLRVQSEAPARYYLTDAAGKPWTPADAIAYERRTENHFVTRNGFEVDLPAGKYTLAAERGPEYKPFRATIHAQSGSYQTIRVALSRWIDMNKRGWYSGDLHNHRRVEDMPLLLLAEDLNLTAAITDWVWDNGQRAPAPQTNEPVRYVDPTHVYSVLDKEVERLKAGPGAVDLLGLRSPISFNGYSLYPPNDTFTRQAHAQGGYVDAEKIVWRDIAALVALGHIDFAGIVHNHFNRQDVELETDAWGMIPKDRPEYKTPADMPLWSMAVYYKFLNCGFRLPVSAGSATGVKPAPLGYNRVYVKTQGKFDYDTWFKSLKAGRSFATNGPLLFLTVSGQEPGAILRFPKGSKQRVKIRVEASSNTPMDRLEILFKGRVVSTANATGPISADFETEITESGWFTARVFEKFDGTIRFAHTSPVYIEFAGDAGIVREDARFFLNWIDREIAFYKDLPGFREPAHRKAMLELFDSARRVYAKLAGSN
jgi:hypothetical protein